MNDTFSVAELTVYIRDLISADDRLQDVTVQGEVSNMTRAASGHVYFTLKDSKSQIKCVMWRSAAERQTRLPDNGDSIVVHGAVNVYEQNGVYQLYADHVRPLGVGDLYRQFELLKAKLDAEGLFDPLRKRPLPEFPHTIGIATSADAAAFQDVQNVLRRRYPLARVVIAPTLVQGVDAPAQIVAALRRLDAYGGCDVIIVCRGGGSIEDLWAFNDEGVARAIAACRVPVICGVGHETDFTIADFAADVRAPTPSAAAELATPDSAELRYGLDELTRSLDSAVQMQLEQRRQAIDDANRSLRQLSPLAQIRNARQRIDDWTARMDRAQQARLHLLRERLGARAEALERANPKAILKRGYALVTLSENGERVISAREAKPGTGITIQLHDGELKARVEDKDTHERYRRTLF
ncbi:MAG: exodeoxyribonuclease VII large subunit [Chloroflexota bacterium]|nr:exodeoxyribonuclease VII large subunit [Chloroflexota bacterium]